MSHSAGVVISTMAKYYSTEEVVDMLMHCESKDGSSSPAEDTEEAYTQSCWSPGPNHLISLLKMRAKGR